MENSLFLALEDKELLDCEGGGAWEMFGKLMEAGGLAEELCDFGAGVVNGFKAAWNR